MSQLWQPGLWPYNKFDAEGKTFSIRLLSTVDLKSHIQVKVTGVETTINHVRNFSKFIVKLQPTRYKTIRTIKK